MMLGFASVVSCCAAADKFVGFELTKHPPVQQESYDVLLGVLNQKITNNKLILSEKELLGSVPALNAVKAKDAYRVIENMMTQRYSPWGFYTIVIGIYKHGDPVQIGRDEQALVNLASKNTKQEASDTTQPDTLQYDVMVGAIKFSTFAYGLGAIVGLSITALLYAYFAGYFTEGDDI